MSTPPAPVGPQAALRERVLSAALDDRPPGRATPAPEPISPVEALRRSADGLAAVLASLTDDQWRRPALRGLDVQGLVGHLIGVEEDVRRALAGADGVADADHVTATQAAAERQRGRPVEETRREWVAVVDRTLELLSAADPQATVALYGVRVPVAGLCVVRTFELWTHENDIRAALNRPASAPDASSLTLMTQLAVDFLPYAVAAAGQARGVRLRLVLTGPGGGTWQLPLGEPIPPSAGTIGVVTDAVGFCRLVANRVTPAELDTYVTGDPEIATAVLQAATTLALD